MRPRLWFLLVLTALIAGGVAHEAFAGREAKPQTARKTLTASQIAARKKLIAQADFLRKHKLDCGCQHHFPTPK